MACHGGTNAVEDGLVLCLDAANPRSYPGTGTVWKDISGNGNDGTLVNVPTFNPSNHIGAFSFDAVNDYGYVEDNSQVKPLEEITVSVFLYCKSSTYSNVRIVGDWHQSSTYDRWIFYTNGNTIRWYMRTSTATEGSVTGWTIVPNTWVNLTGVYTGSSQDLYVNGELFSSRTISGNLRGGDGNRPIRFGGQLAYPGTGSAGGVFDGEISNIQIHNRALTAEEVQQNYKAFRGRYGI